MAANGLIPKLPVGPLFEQGVEWLKGYASLFDLIEWTIDRLSGIFETFLFLFPEWLLPLLVTLIVLLITRRWGLSLFILVGLGVIWNLGYWENMVYTLSLVLTAALLSVVIGIPTGIIAAYSRAVKAVIRPILDFMQTMPAFVYLIPAVFFFGIGTVPGVVASVIFAMPPVIRLTLLGIEQVPGDIVEAADAFGSSRLQKLIKVQLPLAQKTIMAGVNQTIMLALSMVVIASMIGARGLGRDVYKAVTQNDIATGFEAGLCIVILAIFLDRITQLLGTPTRKMKKT